MKFEIKAVRSSEGVVALALEAADEGDARAQARAQGYSVLALRAARSWRAWDRGAGMAASPGSIPTCARRGRVSSWPESSWRPAGVG